MRTKNKLTTKELILFSLFGAIMFCSKVLMDSLPNIHLIGMFIMTFTVVFRGKALIPLYVFVFLTGIYGGFNVWWIPYLYIWTVLWAVTMLLPRSMSRKAKCIVYPIVCALHGLSYGTLYAPFQAVVMSADFKEMLAWIVAGLPWDALHAAGNLVSGLLIVPFSELLVKLTKYYQIEK